VETSRVDRGTTDVIRRGDIVTVTGHQDADRFMATSVALAR
jgi:hypothetical protein